MSTRSLTKVCDSHGEIIVLYRHMDGYPRNHGLELAEFLEDRVIGNGGTGTREKYSNGANCFAGQLISHFKAENLVGNFYVYPAGTNDIGEEYTYTIFAESDCPIGIVVNDYRGEEIFLGSVANFEEFCLTSEE
jgi:hypothetical protein